MSRDIKSIDNCEVDGCKSKATSIVHSRHAKEIIACCKKHGDIIIDEDYPEYWDKCPNCECRFGVN